MSTPDPCFYEEIGEEIGGAVKIYETACDNEHSCADLPNFCQHCGKPVVLAPGCRRCGSTEHTTLWHDANDNPNPNASKPIEIKAISGRDFINKILGEKS